jgi:DNA-binding response OmpR family regulator
MACILVLENDILVRTTLADYLRQCGYQVIEAASSAEARQLLGDSPRAIDVVLADMTTPEEGGLAFAAWVREQHLGVQIILAGTIAKAAEKAGDLCEDGPDVAKPYDHQLVLDRIRRLLAARDRNAPGRPPSS